MDDQTYRPRVTDSDNLEVSNTGSQTSTGSELATHIANLNKLRDIYIDSSLFRNSAWDIFLAIYAKHKEGLRATLASLCAGNRLSETDCAKAIEDLASAGLVRLQADQSDEGPQVVDLTDQGLQRMDAFLRSAERA